MKNINKIKLFFMFAVGLRADYLIQASSSADPTNCLDQHRKIEDLSLVDDLKLENLSYEEVVHIMKTDFKSFLSLFHEKKLKANVNSEGEEIIDYSCYDPGFKAAFYLLQGESYKNFLDRVMHEKMLEAQKDEEPFCFEVGSFHGEAHQAALAKIADEMVESFCNSIGLAIENNVTDLHEINDPKFIYILNMALLNTTYFDFAIKSCLEKNKDKNSLLHKAIKKDNAEVIEYLIRLRVDLNSRDDSNNTPLYLAMSENKEESIKLLVPALIKAKLDLNLSGEQGIPLLCFVSNRASELFIEALIEGKADLNLKDTDGHVPLYYAIVRRLNSVIELLIPALIEAGADLNIPGEIDRDTLLHVAIKHGSNRAIELLIPAGADLNLGDKDKQTPLHVAIVNDNGQAIEMLIEALIETNSDLNLRNYWKLTPLHLAIARDRDRAIEMLIPALIDVNADLNLKDTDGQTPLHYAIARGNDRAIELLIPALIKAKADFKLQDYWKRTPLSLAIEKGNDKAISLINSAIESIESLKKRKHSAIDGK